MKNLILLVTVFFILLPNVGCSEEARGGYVKASMILKVGAQVPSRDQRTSTARQRDDFEFRWSGEITLPAERHDSPVRKFQIQIWQPTHYNMAEFVVLLADTDDQIVSAIRHKVTELWSHKDGRPDFGSHEAPHGKQHFRTASVIDGNRGAGYLYFTLSTGRSLIFGVGNDLVISFRGIFVPPAK